MRWCFKNWFAALGLMMMAASSGSADFTFTKIAGTDHRMPDNLLPNAFGPTPAVDAAGDVAFFAKDRSGDFGIYAYSSINHQLSTVVDNQMTVPGFATFFQSDLTGGAALSGSNALSVSAGTFAIDAGRVAFIGGSSGNASLGVYATSSSGLQTVANLNTSVPGGTSNFNGFSNVSEQGNTVAFVGTSKDAAGLDHSGIYTGTAGGGVTKVFDDQTNISGIGTLHNFSNLTLRDGNLAFTAQDSSGTSGIYTRINGTVTKVADEPSGFQNGSLSFDGKHVSYSDGNNVYSNASGSLVKVADSSTTFPNPSGSLQNHITPYNYGTAISNDTTLFAGGNTGGTLATSNLGLYFTKVGSSLDAVIQGYDQLGGFGNVVTPGIGPDSFRNGFVTFAAGGNIRFSAEKGIFETQFPSPPPPNSAVPAPQSAVLASLGALCLIGYAWWRRKTPAIA